MAIDTGLARCAGHQRSGERSLERPFRKQRTVNPLTVPSPMVPARYNFLYSSQGRPAGGLRPPSAGSRPEGDGHMPKEIILHRYAPCCTVLRTVFETSPVESERKSQCLKQLNRQERLTLSS